jgi:pimeloyl-ACP methyl ester carboxylesterase
MPRFADLRMSLGGLHTASFCLAAQMVREHDDDVNHRFCACSVIVIASFALPSTAQEPVSLRAEDGWTIHADAYGTGDRGVVLVHGGRFTKGDWAKQARALVDAGFRVLAIDLRGFGRSKEGPPSLKRDATYLDVLAAVRYLRSRGTRTVSVIGGSMGGDAAADALGATPAGDIDRVVLLAHGAYGAPEKLVGRKLFVVTRDDANAAGPRLPRIQAQYDKAPEPKELIILDGSAHAQFMFESNQGERLMREILRFLSAP